MLQRSRIRRRIRPQYRRYDATVTIELTEREARTLVRGVDLVLNELRPGLFANNLPGGEHPPMVTAQEVLLAACERAGVDIRQARDHVA